MFSFAAHEPAQQLGGGGVERADADQLVEREQPREAADRHRRAAQRQRRDDHVHALAGGQAGVDHRAGLVDAAVDGRDDPVDRLEELRLVGEGDVGALDPAGALDVDLVGAVDHDLGHGVVGQQRLEHAEADRLVDDAADQPRALGGREHGALARDHAPDDALQPRAALLLGEDRDLGEVDLLQQPAAVVADAVGGAVLAPGAFGDDAIAQAHVSSGSVALRLTRRLSSPSPGKMIGIRTLTLAVSPLISTFMPVAQARARPPSARPSRRCRPRASTRLAVRAALAA